MITRGNAQGTILILALLLCPAADAADGSFIQTMQIRGSGRLPELETHAGQLLDRARIARDVRRLWATGWLEDVRVETSEAPEGVHLVFTVEEKPRLYLRRVEFQPASERRKLGLEKGAPVDRVWAKQVAVAVRRQLVEEGHADARVEAELVPAGFQQADLRLRVEPGRRYRVQEVRFQGSPGLPPEKLRRALRSTRARRLLPGVGGLWNGWRLLPPFSDAGLEADLDSLRSLYVSRGYFDARVGIASVEMAEGKASLTIGVKSGPRYRVRRIEVMGTETGEEIEAQLDGSFPSRELCHCLMKARRNSEQEGRLAFTARLEVEKTPAPEWAWLAAAAAGAEPEGEQAPAGAWVALRAEVETGPAYRVGRIDFRGHHAFGDSTLRRALLLDEGDWFDQGRLRRSLARLNGLGLVEPLSLANVRAERDPDGRRMHLTIGVKEKPRGLWSLSGPLGPVSAFGPLSFTVKSRLPGWGRGPLALSTFNVVFSLLALPAPLAVPLSLGKRTRLLPVIALERPYLPGERWRSGFLLSPQLGWKGALTSYGLTQARQSLGGALAGGSALTPDLYVPAQWSDAELEGRAADAAGGILRCEAPKPSWRWLRAAGGVATNLLLTPLVAGL